MKKKRVLKDWVYITLSMINIFCLMFMAADFENMVVFHTVHIIALIIFIFNSILILKYGKTDLFD